MGLHYALNLNFSKTVLIICIFSSCCPGSSFRSSLQITRSRWARLESSRCFSSGKSVPSPYSFLCLLLLSAMPFFILAFSSGNGLRLFLTCPPLPLQSHPCSWRNYLPWGSAIIQHRSILHENDTNFDYGLCAILPRLSDPHWWTASRIATFSLDRKWMPYSNASEVTDSVAAAPHRRGNVPSCQQSKSTDNFLRVRSGASAKNLYINHQTPPADRE